MVRLENHSETYLRKECRFLQYLNLENPKMLKCKQIKRACSESTSRGHF